MNSAQLQMADTMDAVRRAHARAELPSNPWRHLTPPAEYRVNTDTCTAHDVAGCPSLFRGYTPTRVIREADDPSIVAALTPCRRCLIA